PTAHVHVILQHVVQATKSHSVACPPEGYCVFNQLAEVAAPSGAPIVPSLINPIADVNGHASGGVRCVVKGYDGVTRLPSARVGNGIPVVSDRADDRA